MKLKVYDGSARPKTAVGKNQCHLLEFATKYYGWHTFAKDRATLRAVEGLVRRGSIVVSGDQFRKA